jgi:hypothetical protein
LIDAIARDTQPGLEGVIAAHERDRVARVDVSCRRQQRARGAEEACEAVDRRVWNRILESTTVKEQLLELEAVSFTFPKIAVWWNSLGHDRPFAFASLMNVGLIIHECEI